MTKEVRIKAKKDELKKVIYRILFLAGLSPPEAYIFLKEEIFQELSNVL